LKIKDSRALAKTQAGRVAKASQSYVLDNSGMGKRTRRFSLHEAFFEGSRTDGREDCLSMLKSDKDETKGKNQKPDP
jgi:hypothetical protein